MIKKKKVFQRIIFIIDKDEGGLMFLDAPGGTERTFLLNLILAELRQKGKKASFLRGRCNLLTW